MLDTLGEACERTGFRIHAYVLMPNHYHFLLETPEPNLVAGMHWFQTTYTQRFNLRHGMCGHLFQGRYKAIPVDAESAGYFRAVSDYIHLNPARAKMLGGPGRELRGYRWSSYPAMVGSGALPPWLVRSRVFDAHDLAEASNRSRTRYRAYMERLSRSVTEGNVREEDEEAWKAIRRGWYVGRDTFRDKLVDLVDQAVKGRRRDSFRSEGTILHDERAALARLDEVGRVMGIPLEDLRARRQNDPIKQLAAWWIKSQTAVKDAWICDRLAMGNRVNVSRAVGAYRNPRDAMRKKLASRMYKCTD